MVTKEQVKKCLEKFANDYLSTREETECFDYAIKVLDERKTGRWEWYKESPTYMRCSACGKAEFRKTKYCPNCGAKMEGAEE